MLEAGVLQQLTRTKTGGVLFGASICGRQPSPAMISVFVERFNQHLHEHGPHVPLVRAFAREDRYPRLPEITVPTVVRARR